jgi:hypothetical protein
VSDIDILLISSSFTSKNYFLYDTVIDVDESRIIISVTDNLCQWYGSCKLQCSEDKPENMCPVLYRSASAARVSERRYERKVEDGYKLFDSHGG